MVLPLVHSSPVVSHFSSVSTVLLLPRFFSYTKVDCSKFSGCTDDAIWTDDNVLWLMEEMLVVRDRKDKHLLKNRVVFREIAATFNEENFMVDWKQVLQKWQTMYVIYSKISSGLMQPSQWEHFEVCCLHIIMFNSFILV